MHAKDSLPLLNHDLELLLGVEDVSLGDWVID